jgi:glycosidase
MGNHDRNRTASRFPGRADQMTMLAMILPGIAVTYYGEEIGMFDKTDISWEDTQDPQACNAGKEKYKSRSRDPVRTPFQWHNENKNAGARPDKPENCPCFRINSFPLFKKYARTQKSRSYFYFTTNIRYTKKYFKKILK